MSSIVFQNNTNLDIDISFLNPIMDYLTAKNIELSLVNSDEMRNINKEQRNIDKDTDVLSFPFEEMNIPDFPLGCIVVSLDLVEKCAKEFNHSFEDEFSLLFIHGMLHILGYDHEVDNGEHREKEKEVINKFELPNSLIVRND